MPGDLCTTTLPELLPSEHGEGHLKRCHLANPGEIFTNEVLAEIAPDLFDPETGEVREEYAADGGPGLDDAAAVAAESDSTAQDR